MSVRPVLFLVASPPEEEEAYTLGLVQNKKKKKKYTSKPLYINTQHTYTHSLSTIKASYKQLSTRPLKGYLSFFLALSLLAYTERERKRGVLYFSLGKEWGESMLAFGAGETVMSRVHPTATSLRENKKTKKNLMKTFKRPNRYEERHVELSFILFFSICRTSPKQAAYIRNVNCWHHLHPASLLSNIETSPITVRLNTEDVLLTCHSIFWESEQRQLVVVERRPSHLFLLLIFFSSFCFFFFLLVLLLARAPIVLHMYTRQ